MAKKEYYFTSKKRGDENVRKFNSRKKCVKYLDITGVDVGLL